MKQKTAMQCAIELIEQYIDGKITMAELSNEFKVELLEKEKEQIIEAYNSYDSVKYIDELTGITVCTFFIDAEQFYKWKYKQD